MAIALPVQVIISRGNRLVFIVNIGFICAKVNESALLKLFIFLSICLKLPGKL